MLFNTWSYLFVFLPICVFAYHCINYKYLKLRKILLIIMSLIFYSIWDVNNLPIILVSILLNFWFGKQLLSHPSKIKLGIFISFNILGLSFYKYSSGIFSNIGSFASLDFGVDDLVLPLAISFFTIQQINFLIDCYSKEQKSIYIIDYFLFITFFPQLISGPIVYFKELIPQFKNKVGNPSKTNFICRGLILISIGLFKKVVLADTFAAAVNLSLENVSNISSFEAWSLILQNSLQFYFDFSGYIDMALGSGLLFGIVLPINFNSPLRQKNIKDLWANWHVTLTRFMRKNVYIKLGGNKRGQYRRNMAILITFVLSGVWHGGHINYSLWGAINGIGVVLYLYWDKLNIKLPKFISLVLTFLFFSISLLMLRVLSKEKLITIYSKILRLDEVFVSLPPLSNLIGVESFILILGIILILVKDNSNRYLEKINQFSIKDLIIFLGCFIISVSCMLGTGEANEFIYFSF